MPTKTENAEKPIVIKVAEGVDLSKGGRFLVKVEVGVGDTNSNQEIPLFFQIPPEPQEIKGVVYVQETDPLEIEFIQRINGEETAIVAGDDNNKYYTLAVNKDEIADGYVVQPKTWHMTIGHPADGVVVPVEGGRVVREVTLNVTDKRLEFNLPSEKDKVYNYDGKKLSYRAVGRVTQVSPRTRTRTVKFSHTGDPNNPQNHLTNTLLFKHPPYSTYLFTFYRVTKGTGVTYFSKNGTSFTDPTNPPDTVINEVKRNNSPEIVYMGYEGESVDFYYRQFYTYENRSEIFWLNEEAVQVGSTDTF